MLTVCKLLEHGIVSPRISMDNCCEMPVRVKPAGIESVEGMWSENLDFLGQVFAVVLFH